MPRPPRYNEVGIYHVINRGVEKRDIYLSHGDFEQFLLLLNDLKDKYGVILHTYCLMDNHYHLLIETVVDNLSDAIKYLNVNYAKYFNASNTRVGHLWQGRFKSYPIFDEKGFWTVSKYIERNPIAAGFTKGLDGYPYQSYAVLSDKNHKHYSLLEQSKIKEMSLHDYREYLGVPLGSEYLKSIYKIEKVNKETKDKKVLTQSLESLFESEGERNEKIRRAYFYGYTQTAIADYLGVSKMTINKIIRAEKK